MEEDKANLMCLILYYVASWFTMLPEDLASNLKPRHRCGYDCEKREQVFREDCRKF